MGGVHIARTLRAPGAYLAPAAGATRDPVAFLATLGD
jgi:hypothetical protein